MVAANGATRTAGANPTIDTTEATPTPPRSYAQISSATQTAHSPTENTRKDSSALRMPGRRTADLEDAPGRTRRIAIGLSKRTQLQHP